MCCAVGLLITESIIFALQSHLSLYLMWLSISLLSGCKLLCLAGLLDNICLTSALQVSLWRSLVMWTAWTKELWNHQNQLRSKTLDLLKAYLQVKWTWASACWEKFCCCAEIWGETKLKKVTPANPFGDFMVQIMYFYSLGAAYNGILVLFKRQLPHKRVMPNSWRRRSNYSPADVSVPLIRKEFMLRFWTLLCCNLFGEYTWYTFPVIALVPHG